MRKLKMAWLVGLCVAISLIEKVSSVSQKDKGPGGQGHGQLARSVPPLDNLDENLQKWWNLVSTTYPKYNATTVMLKEMEKDFPDVVKIYSIGKSDQGRELWVIKMTIDVDRERPLTKPMVKHVANIHGNEALGRSLVLMFAINLLKEYKKDKGLRARDADFRIRAVNILRSVELHLVPSLNPDGFEIASSEDCGDTPEDLALFEKGGRGRRNGRDVDLNRNFPDPFYIDKDEYFDTFSDDRQTETAQIMKWILTNPFVLSTNLHGGNVVASYGYDAVPKEINELSSYNGHDVYSLAPDDTLFQQLANAYSSNHNTMRNFESLKNLQDNGDGIEKDCIAETDFPKGITNGAHWFSVRGGMQDFNYIWTNCIELTIELSCCKYPPANQLQDEWDSNKQSLYTFTETVLSWGFKGIVTDDQGNPVHAASIIVEGNDKQMLTTSRGEYWRMLKSANEVTKYTVHAEFEGCKSEKLSIDLNNTSEMSIVNFKLPNCPALEKNSAFSPVGFGLLIDLIIFILTSLFLLPNVFYY